MKAPARAAGLACDNGSVVDLAARTSDAAIHAIGACTQWPITGPAASKAANALEQAKQAAADLCGSPEPTPEVPWFWSDQYDARLQIAGLSFAVTETVERGDPLTGSFTIFHLAADGTVQAVEAVNAPADFVAGRIMIARRKQAVAARLRGVSCSMRELAAEPLTEIHELPERKLSPSHYQGCINHVRSRLKAAPFCWPFMLQ